MPRSRPVGAPHAAARATTDGALHRQCPGPVQAVPLCHRMQAWRGHRSVDERRRGPPVDRGTCDRPKARRRPALEQRDQGSRIPPPGARTERDARPADQPGPGVKSTGARDTEAAGLTAESGLRAGASHDTLQKTDLPYHFPLVVFSCLSDACFGSKNCSFTLVKGVYLKMCARFGHVDSS